VIPVRDNEVTKQEIASEGIPTPKHLRIFPELGRGGMGRIHPARDRNLVRHVALKRLDRELAKEPFYRDGFIAEAQITGQLEHPNIVPVHELQVAPNGVPYFTMKLVQGVSLDRWLKEQRRQLGSTERIEDGLEILLKVCDAVAYTGAWCIVISSRTTSWSPGSDRFDLMDWGSPPDEDAPCVRRRFTDGSAGPCGTPDYMAPEQAPNPSEMDRRSDVFRNRCDSLRDRERQGALRTPAQRGRGAQAKPQSAQCPDRTSRSRGRRVADAPQHRGEGDRNRTVTRACSTQRDLSVPRGGLYLPRKAFGPGDVIIRR
jgi:hypothetical protein